MAIFDSIRAGASAAASAFDVPYAVRFYSASDSKLYRTGSSTSTSYTVSMWFKPTMEYENKYRIIWSNLNNGNSFNLSNAQNLRMTRDNHHHTASTSVHRDCAQWYHFVFKNNNGTGTCYLNGETVPNLESPSANPLAATNIRIGWSGGDAGEFTFDGLFAQAALIDGTALDPDSFAETNLETGQWVPKDLSNLTFGSDGYWLKFENASDLGEDSSGNNNDFTTGNLDAHDRVTDTPTNCFATFATLASANIHIEEGGLVLRANDGAWRTGLTTHVLESGKWYCEAKVLEKGTYQIVGTIPKTRVSHLYDVNINNDYYPGTGSDEYGYETRGYLHNNASPNTSWGATYTTGDIIGVAIDKDNNTLKLYKNNSQQGSTINLTSEGQRLAFTCYGSTSRMCVNFGQEGTFVGTETSQGNTDGNGIGDFYYTPPSGYLAICSKNFEPSIKLPNKHFEAKIYTGNNSTTQNITGFEFSPDLTWISRRNGTSNNLLIDTVRGATKAVRSNSSNTEFTISDFSHNADSITVSGTSGNDSMNNNTQTYVSWNWEGADSTVTNTNGTINSSIRANPSAGFSIVKYTGDGGSSTNVGHGLGVSPNLIWVKSLDHSDQWQVYWNLGTAASTSDNGFLNTTGAFNSSGQGPAAADKFGQCTVSSTVFSVGDGAGGDTYSNGNGDDYIAYCFSSVEGYSEVGVYAGNGVNTNGAYIMTGFRPAFVIIKSMSTSKRWVIYDNKRNPYNKTNNELYANQGNSENSLDGHTGIDFVSNGFRCSTSNSTINGDGVYFLYLAIAEAPWAYARGR